MKFGREFRCPICKKDIDGDYHRYTCEYAGIDMEFYTCDGDCNKKFRDEYVEPFNSVEIFEKIESRFDILDL